MAGIQVISTSTIQAHLIGDSTQRIHLNPWDLACLPLEMTQRGLLYHKPINTRDTSTQIQHLKHSLSTTLTFFPPLAGRLTINQHENNTASSFIQCNNEGALFVHAVAENTTVADILEPNYVPLIVLSFFQLSGVKCYEGTSQPLLAVQVTELVDGIFIGCSINHVVADGQSTCHFLNSWSEISRGFDKVSKVPALERWFPDGIDLPMRFPFTKEEKQHSDNTTPQISRIFHFTKEKIAQLKSKANFEANTDKISSLQALLTHLWRCVIRCQGIDPQRETGFYSPIGTRWRMVPPLVENYFGNAGYIGGVTMKVGELLEGGLGKGAWKMNTMIASHSYEKVKGYYEYWVRTPRLHKDVSNDVYPVVAFGITSSPRFNFYGCDFCWGKPVAVRSGCSSKKLGRITVFGGVEEGSIDIEVCLPCDTLETMGNDLEFMGDISI